VSGKCAIIIYFTFEVKLPRIKLYTFNQLPSCGYPTIPILVSCLPIIITENTAYLPWAWQSIYHGWEPIYIQAMMHGDVRSDYPPLASFAYHDIYYPSTASIQLRPPASNIIQSMYTDLHYCRHSFTRKDAQTNNYVNILPSWRQPT
jgi:hypothetical protein